MDKTCPKCNQTKNITLFTKKKKDPTKYYSWCKDCLSIHNRKKYKNRKQEILKVLNITCCSKCGYNKYMGALEFHHTTQDKNFNISKNHSLRQSLDEAKKCIVLCSNCHKEEHYRLSQN